MRGLLPLRLRAWQSRNGALPRVTGEGNRETPDCWTQCDRRAPRCADSETARCAGGNTTFPDTGFAERLVTEVNEFFEPCLRRRHFLRSDHASTIGLQTMPLTAVLPMCSMVLGSTFRQVARRLRSATNTCSHCGRNDSSCTASSIIGQVSNRAMINRRNRGVP